MSNRIRRSAAGYSPQLRNLFLGGLVLFVVSLAQSLAAWAPLLALSGLLMPICGVGANSSIADLTPVEQHSGAYALMRVANNTRIAIGPAIGGFILMMTTNAATVVLFQYSVTRVSQRYPPLRVMALVASRRGP